MRVGSGKRKLHTPEPILEMPVLIKQLAFLLVIVLQVFILFLLMRRRLARRFPWFLVYIIYELVEDVLRFSVVGKRHLYFYVYWLTSIGGLILSIGAMRESFLNVFRAYTRFRWFTRIVWAAVAFALTYAVVRAWFFAPIKVDRITAIAIDVETAVDYSLAVVGILYFALVKFHKITEHQWESGIIAGFMTLGTFSSVNLAVQAVFGFQRFTSFTEWTGFIGYIAAEIEWGLALSRAERKTPKWIQKYNVSIDDLTRLDKYISILGKVFGRKRDD